jgi:hypothetical protein
MEVQHIHVLHVLPCPALSVPALSPPAAVESGLSLFPPRALMNATTTSTTSPCIHTLPCLVLPCLSLHVPA